VIDWGNVIADPCSLGGKWMTGGVLVISGGVDSVTMLYHLVNCNIKPLYALSFNYGQRHLKELVCAERICKELNIPHKVVDISSIQSLIAKGSLTGNEKVPYGNYTEESQKSTIVPNRNMIFLSIATGYAITKGVSTVYYAAHLGDRTIYPDCTKEFVKALDTAVFIGNKWTPVEVKAPFIDMKKSDIVKLGLELEVPYGMTYSCYEGDVVACGQCGTCVERIEAFMSNGVVDPIKYKVVVDWGSCNEIK
jgi:7-cyano-7-deazaguanine synthase